MRWTRPHGSEAYKRSFRLLSFLKQSLSGFDRAEDVFQHYQQTEPLGETHGYEALRRLSLELSIKSRGEIMQFKEKFMSLTVGKGTRVMDIVRHVETQASQYAQVLSGSAFAGGMSLTLPDADKVMVIMRLLPDSVREYVQLHGSYIWVICRGEECSRPVRPEAESIWFWVASQCGASAAKHAKRIAAGKP